MDITHGHPAGESVFCRGQSSDNHLLLGSRPLRRSPPPVAPSINEFLCNSLVQARVTRLAVKVGAAARITIQACDSLLGLPAARPDQSRDPSLLNSPASHQAMFSKTSIVAAVALAAQTVSATDYVGGWASSSTCVDICTTASSSPSCSSSSSYYSNCLAKTLSPGDFDYLMLEQLFIPQFCDELLSGVDVTISHQNVNAYPDGITCVESKVSSVMTIHGMWAQYYGGYPGCCNVSSTIRNAPYNAGTFLEDQGDLLDSMAAVWVDPTQSTTNATLCEIYNHEFQKHGLCYYADGSDYESAAVTYFEATLAANELVADATTQINTWAASDSASTTLEEINALYPNYVQVLCSGTDGLNSLVAIRVCFSKPSTVGSAGPTAFEDCPTASNSTMIVCSAYSPILLTAYAAPGLEGQTGLAGPRNKFNSGEGRIQMTMKTFLLPVTRHAPLNLQVLKTVSDHFAKSRVCLRVAFAPDAPTDIARLAPQMANRHPELFDRPNIVDFSKPKEVAEAMEGCDGAIFSSGEDDPALLTNELNLAKAAKDLALPHIIKVSCAEGLLGEKSGVELGRTHWMIEQTLQQGLQGDRTLQLVRPNMSMQRFLHGRLFEMVCGRTISVSVKNGRIAFVNDLDVAEVVNVLLQDASKLTGNAADQVKTYTLTGPESLSYEDVARQLTQAIGQDVRYSYFPLWAVQPALWIKGVRPDVVNAEISQARAYESGAEGEVTDTIEKLLHKPAHTFHDFAAANKNAWPLASFK